MKIIPILPISNTTNKRISLVGLLKYWYLFVVLVLICSIPPKVAADCQPVYGGGLTCQDNSLSIQKQVLNPNNNKFVHNLGLSDPTFKPNDLVTFQVVLTNNGANTLQKVVVKDNFPNILSFSDGPGQFDKNLGVLTFEVDNLASHHSQLFTVIGKVVPQDQFPIREDKFCEQNKVSALANSGSVAQDSSQFCLSNNPLSSAKSQLTTTPATGAESNILLSLFALIPLGWRLRKLV